MERFKTAKGTEIPILTLEGKPYLQVAHRILWFREEHPDWGIETSVKMLDYLEDGMSCMGTATIKNAEGRIISMAHKVEDIKGFPDFVEKSETGAIGRALALCGYGTQFTTELDENHRLADSPIDRINVSAPHPLGISEAQGKRMWAISKKANWTQGELKAYLEMEAGVSSIKDVPSGAYNRFCTFIETHPKQGETT